MGKEQLSKVDNGCSSFSFPAGIYRVDNGPQGRVTTEVGGQIQPPIHTRLRTGKQTSHVPQICFATNSSRKFFGTASTDSFWEKKNSSLKMTHNKKLEGDMAEMVSEPGWIKYASCFLLLWHRLQAGKSAQGHNYTYLISEHLLIWSAYARMRMLSTY